jgi:hypothetical protein
MTVYGIFVSLVSQAHRMRVGHNMIPRVGVVGMKGWSVIHVSCHCGSIVHSRRTVMWQTVIISRSHDCNDLVTEILSIRDGLVLLGRERVVRLRNEDDLIRWRRLLFSRGIDSWRCSWTDDVWLHNRSWGYFL